MDEPPKLRKRSEVGKKQEELPMKPADPGFPDGYAGANQGTGEDIGAFASVVKGAGIRCGVEEVTLVEMARWGEQARNEVRRWLHAGQPPGRQPACLGAARTGDAVGGGCGVEEKPKTRLASRGKQDEALAPATEPQKGGRGVPPSPAGPQNPLADRVPESAPARAPQKGPGPAPDPFLEQVRSALFTKGVTHLRLADMWGWTRTQLDVAAAWVDQGGKQDEMPGWLERHRDARVRMNVQAMAGDGPQAGDEDARWPEKQKSERSDLPDKLVSANGPEWKDDSLKPQKKSERSDLKKSGEGSASDLPKVQEPNDDYQRFVLTVMRTLDLESEYTELEAALEIGEDRRDYSRLNEEVDRAQRRAQRANGIWANAVIEHERLKLDQKEVDAALWKQAMARLESEGSKTRIADVDAKIAELFPDEWREGRLRIKRSEVAVERAKSFQDRWAQRERALVAMLSACRK